MVTLVKGHYYSSGMSMQDEDGSSQEAMTSDNRRLVTTAHVYNIQYPLACREASE